MRRGLLKAKSMDNENETYGEDPRSLDKRTSPKYATQGDTEMPLTPRFALGTVVATRRALDFLCVHVMSAHRLAYRHQSGDFGDLDAGDIHENELAIAKDNRILSAYQIAGERLMVITEADRSITTVMLAEEY